MEMAVPVPAEDDRDCFCPGDDQLINHYLHAKTAGKTSLLANACYFDDADVCSAGPDDLVRDHGVLASVPRKDAAGGEQWFFFSPARFTGASMKRQSRTVDGTGDAECWHAEGRPRPVEGGFVQKFTYHVKVAPGVLEKPGWIMAEYTSKNVVGMGETVLCKIYRSPRGPGSRKNESLSSAAAKSRCKSKTKAAEDLEAAASRSSKRRGPRKTKEDDATPFHGDIESDELLSFTEDPTTAPEFGEVRHAEEWQHLPTPEFGEVLYDYVEQWQFPQVAGEFTTLLTAEYDIDDLKVLGILPNGGGEDDAQASYNQQQDAGVQTAQTPRDVIAALQSWPYPHPDSNIGVPST
jgi:hypothetical protein